MGDLKDPRVEHLLALKVMRLTRPSFAQPLIVKDDSEGFFEGVLHAENAKDPSFCKKLPLSAVSPILVLPQSFGSIYLGETFSSYISLHNDSTETCRNITIKCDLQTSTQRITLLPSTLPDQPVLPTSTVVFEELLPGGSIDHVLNHEVKELGTHILVCEVSYTGFKMGSTTLEEKYNFRKFFKFPVLKPLDVKTKFYNADSEAVFLEAQVQNVTNGVLCLEKVVLGSSPLFHVSSLNSVIGKDCDDSIFGAVNCLRPQDSRQYLFCLTPKPDVKNNYKLLKGVTNLGKLDIVWRTNMGDRGHLQTSQLQRLPPSHGDIRFSIENIPNVVKLYQVFDLKAKLINNSERTLELEINCLDKNKSRMIWSGTVYKKLGLLEPSGSMDIQLSVVPHEVGMQTISGIRITDTLLKRTYECDDLCEIFVTSKDQIFEATDCS